MTYYVHKARTECPICHKIYDIQAPTPPIVITTLDVSQPQPIRVVVVANEETDNWRCTRTSRRISIVILFFFCIFMIVIHYIYK
jgi:hypothetical protein